MDINSVVLSGTMTRNIEIRKTNTGKSVGRFTLAVNGIQKDKVNFIPIVVWDKTADAMAQYAGKGSRLTIHGRVSLEPYTDKNTGKKVNYLQITASEVAFQALKKPEPEQQNSHQTQNYAGNPGDMDDPFEMSGEIQISSDQLPF